MNRRISVFRSVAFKRANKYNVGDQNPAFTITEPNTMKICPRCQKTYVDDNLNFCLEDGSVLNAATASAAPPDTVFMNQVSPTQPQSSMPSQPAGQPGWNTPQSYSMQPPKKSSKTWLWVLGILGLVVVLCGGGFGALVFIGMKAEQANQQRATNIRSSNTTTSNRTTTASNSNTTTTNSTTVSTSSRTDLETVDLEPWVKEFSAYGNTEFTGGEFMMSSKKKGFYYVLVAPEEYKSTGADTRVTLRSMDDTTGSLGYGLIFHSNPTPLQQGYAFLIDTKKKKYRVVHHEPGTEKPVVSWTSSPAIKEGLAENILEARDFPDRVELYINGTMVTSIKNIYGYPNGVPGLYAGDGVKVAFKNLEIRK